MSLVSVVVSAYNYAAYIPQALDSVLAQTHADLDVVVVDDGSTDNTAEVVARYLSDPRVRYVYQDNAGQAAAKNRGLRESASDLVAFLDADDVCLPTRIEKQLRLFDDPDVGVVYAKRVLIDALGKESPFNHPPLYRGWVLDRAFVDNFICFSSSMVRKPFFLRAGGFDESMAMGIDYDLWIRMAAICAFDYVDEELVKYRVGHGNMSTNTEKRLRSAWDIQERNLRDPEVRRRLRPGTVGEARACLLRTYGKLRAAQGRPLAALGFFGASLSRRPLWAGTWRAMLRAAMPQRAVDLYKGLRRPKEARGS
ncbi:glycosyltransferase family 2 protein [Desulfohalovibrio reitneri]|uniref:glycosyltransferase family 2 protein n=1 Tax=Desulfohalovibrio reitneri TaxID=1307759 RepID=UPI00068BEBEB|nr:glycosyltransferase [Desulfohalovibrio reitneri]